MLIVLRWRNPFSLVALEARSDDIIRRIEPAERNGHLVIPGQASGPGSVRAAAVKALPALGPHQATEISLSESAEQSTTARHDAGGLAFR
jgi:hypothetical protein